MKSVVALVLALAGMAVMYVVVAKPLIRSATSEVCQAYAIENGLIVDEIMERGLSRDRAGSCRFSSTDGGTVWLDDSAMTRSLAYHLRYHGGRVLLVIGAGLGMGLARWILGD